VLGVALVLVTSQQVADEVSKEIDEYVFEALRVGASGFLLKDEEPVELLRAVRVVANGDSLLSPRVARRMVETFASGPNRTRRRSPGSTS
jgi:DNA-binding NarL/FixJ family response regulator